MYGTPKLAMATGGTNSPTSPETTTITDTNYTVPFAAGTMYRALTIVVDPTNSAGSADVEARPSNSDAWYPLTSIDLSDGVTKSEQLTAPFGQIRVKNTGNSGITVWIQGIPNN